MFSRMLLAPFPSADITQCHEIRFGRRSSQRTVSLLDALTEVKRSLSTSSRGAGCICNFDEMIAAEGVQCAMTRSAVDMQTRLPKPTAWFGDV